MLLFSQPVKKENTIFSLRHIGYSLFMIMSLLWLTISIPFVYEAQKVQKEIQKDTRQYEDNNPFSNTTEEKNESSANTLSEFLHELNLAVQHPVTVIRYYKCYPFDIYFEHHPELLSPPPEA